MSNRVGKGQPNAVEFIGYLGNPITVKNYSQCLNKTLKYSPYFKGETIIGFEDLDFSEDPIKKAISSMLDNKGEKTEKVGRNQLCPCGSGIKYKRCCGK